MGMISPECMKDIAPEEKKKIIHDCANKGKQSYFFENDGIHYDCRINFLAQQAPGRCGYPDYFKTPQCCQGYKSPKKVSKKNP